MFQTGTFICGAVGLDTDLSFVYQLFALMFCILVFARLSLRFQIPEVSIRRQLPRYATAGEPFEYFVSVFNEGDRVERDLSIIDNPKVVPPDFEQFQRSKEPGDHFHTQGLAPTMLRSCSESSAVESGEGQMENVGSG